MPTDVSFEVLQEYPAELIKYAADEAERDAEDVAAFLGAAGLAPPSGETRGFPPGVLLDLGAVVRLRRWEAAGHAVHIEAGLPTAGAALNHLINTLVAVTTNPTALRVAGQLSRAVFDLTVTRFAWTARSELGSDIVLHADDEEMLVDAVARFLWSHRHDSPATE
jgi:hypothetical protein